jgi:hypothetical protein
MWFCSVNHVCCDFFGPHSLDCKDTAQQPGIVRAPRAANVQVRWMILLQIAALHVVCVSSFVAFR